MFQLFIEKNNGVNDWVELELNGSESLNFTFVRSDIEELQNRNSSFSQNIEVPGTQKNRKNLQHIYNLDRISPNTSVIYINKLFNCEYILDEISFRSQLELESISILRETDEIIFNCSIRSTSILIKERIGDKLLTKNTNKADDLDFSEYKHAFTAQNIKNSWTSPAGTGYYYPIINYNNYGASNQIPLSSQRPALYSYQILKKIFEDAGLTFQSNFIDSNEYKKILHPWCGKTEANPDELRAKEFRAGLSDPIFNTNRRTTGGGWTRLRVLYTNDNAPAPLDFYDNSNLYQPAFGRYNVSSGGMYRFSFLATISPVFTYFQAAAATYLTNIGSQSQIKFFIAVRRGGKDIILGSQTYIYKPADGFKVILTNPYSDNFNVVDSKITISVETPEVQLYAGEQVFVEMAFTNEISFYPENASGSIRFGLRYRFFKNYDSGAPSCVFAVKAIQSPNLFLGENIDPSSGLPEKIKQFDYLKSIMNLFNLVIIEDPLNPTNFTLEPRVNVIGKNNKKYWDDKIDNNQEIEVKRVPTLIRKNFRLLYKPDKDFFNEDYVNYFGTEPYGSYVKRNRENTSENYDVEVIFSQTPHNYHNDSKVIIPQLYALDAAGKLNLGNPFNMRILYRTDIDTTSTNFKNYTGEKPFNIYLVGDKEGANNQTIRITNDIWYGIGNFNFTFTTNVIPTANHFENPYSPNTNDLNFGYQRTYYVPLPSTYPSQQNLYNRFWSDLVEDIIDIDSKLVVVKVKLTTKDIFELSFDDVIVFDGQKWVINRISDWTKGNLSSVELLKINE